MPVPLINQVLADGVGSIPHAGSLAEFIAVVAVVYLLKKYFQGATNKSERNMHSKVVMITGGTSGIGAEVVRGLANRGAQIVLLTQHPITDHFLVEWIDDMRNETSNELITAEQVDLASLHSVRTFATKWIDNAPPRRLDMVILCANTLTPKGGKLKSTEDDVESNWAVNYLANFHLLSILSPALRVQPADRDVRVIIGTCVSYLGGELPIPSADSAKGKKSTSDKAFAAASSFSPSGAYATSKLALMTFAQAYQKHLSSYARPDKQPTNTRVILVDPGLSRTPGMRRYLSWGSLFGLALYLIMYPIWWLLLKSPDKGAETFLYAAMEARWGRDEGGWMLKECMEVPFGRGEVKDEAVQKALWQYSEQMVQEAEKRSAKVRAGRAAAEKSAGNKGEDKAQGKTESSTATPDGSTNTRSRRSKKG